MVMLMYGFRKGCLILLIKKVNTDVELGSHLHQRNVLLYIEEIKAVEVETVHSIQGLKSRISRVRPRLG